MCKQVCVGMASTQHKTGSNQDIAEEMRNIDLGSLGENSARQGAARQMV